MREWVSENEEETNGEKTGIVNNDKRQKKGRNT